MHTLNIQKTGLTAGLLLGGWHFAWSLLVATGWAQAVYNFVLWAHMIHLPITIGPFDLTAAAVLIVMTAIVGYILGIVFAWVWNKVHRS
ncbi:MAG TPA: hypothetical protein VJJ20_02650 [Candidatus Paceibacterota bacterium]